MPRDLDFRRSTTSSPQPNPPVSKPKKERSNKPSPWPLIILILGLILAAIGLYIYFNRDKALPNSLGAKSQPTVTNQSAEQTTTDASKNAFTAQQSSLIVKVYDSGAGEAAVAETLELLKQQNYETENLGKSQFEYDKTYIWHTAEFNAEAQAITALLPNRQVSLKESQIAGVFDVLIYLGKQ